MDEATRKLFGRRLRELRNRSNLSQPQLARQVPVSQATLSRYESGKQTIDPATAARLDDLLDAGGALRVLRHEVAGADNLLRHGDGVPPRSAGGSVMPYGGAAVYLTSGVPSNGSPLCNYVESAAQESWNHVMAVASSMADSTIELMEVEVARLINEYTAMAARDRFGELLGLRNMLFELLERSQRPANMRDLYVLAARVCVMLAYTSQDLGFADAGAKQARAAWGYAQMAGHDDLRVHARNVQANIVFWSGRPADSVALVESELEAASAARRAPLLYNHARASAALGRSDDAIHSLRSADVIADQAPDDHLWAGTSFEWRPASGLLLSASTYVRLGLGVKAVTLAEESLATFRTRASGEKPSNAESRALLELACARVLTDDLDGAAEALHVVLGIDPRYRAERLVGRVETFRRALADSRFAEANETQELADQAVEFVRTSLPRTVPRELGSSL